MNFDKIIVKIKKPNLDTKTNIELLLKITNENFEKLNIINIEKFCDRLLEVINHPLFKAQIYARHNKEIILIVKEMDNVITFKKD